MTRDQIDRVFGRDRLKMVTGDHVEVFREAASDGSRRRYTKRFLDTRPIRNLGLSSYSLYLTHGPIVVLVYDEVVSKRFAHGSTAFLLTFVLAVPLTIAFARVFAALFEHPFLGRRAWSWPVRRRHPAVKQVPA